MLLHSTRSWQPRPATTRLLEVHYIGRTKVRGKTAERSAVGWMDGRWSVILPEVVLQAWFEPAAATPEAPAEHATLYTVLMLRPPTTPEGVKAAYRRMAMQWHPDRCHEPDAAEQFRRIHHAYQVLSDPMQAKKYAAGLVLEQQIAARETRMSGPFRLRAYSHPFPLDPYGYRSPLRCGWIMATGTQNPSWFVVNTILAWADIVNQDGETMCASWPKDATEPEVLWV